MKTYPGLPEPTVDVNLDYEASRERYGGKAEFLIASLHLCGNTGTYVDTPHHRYPTGIDLADLPLERVADLPVIVIDATRAGRAIGPELFGGELAGRAVLVRSDFSRHWGTEAYFSEHPYLTAETADILVNAKASFVGIDSLNIDDTADLSRPAHTKLLGAGIPVCEHMTDLAAVPRSGGRLHAVPIAWVGGASFPVRAYVIAEGKDPAEVTDTRPAAAADLTLKALRERAAQAKKAEEPVAIDPDRVLRLLDAHDAALRLADTVESLRSAQTGTTGSADVRESERVTMSEMRNRWRRAIEERGMAVDSALSSFRTATS